MNKPRDYYEDESTDDTFGEDEVDYSDDDSLLRSSGGDSSPINLTASHRRSGEGFNPSLHHLALDSEEDFEEIEEVSLEEVQMLLGTEPSYEMSAVEEIL